MEQSASEAETIWNLLSCNQGILYFTPYDDELHFDTSCNGLVPSTCWYNEENVLKLNCVML